jgi:spermidine synthase
MRFVRLQQTLFQEIAIWKTHLITEFRVSGATHAAFHRKRFLFGLAWDIIAAGVLLRQAGQPKSILMLGVAGGTSLRTLHHLLPDAQLTGVDLDAELIELAHQEMALSDCGATIHIGDAYSWLRSNKLRYDVIIDDLYLAGKEDVFRTDDGGEDWISEIKRCLKPGGILVLNLVIGAGHRRIQSTLRRALEEQFPVVRSVKTEDSLNEVLVAGDEVATASRLEDFTDLFESSRDRMFWKRIKVRKLK